MYVFHMPKTVAEEESELISECRHIIIFLLYHLPPDWFKYVFNLYLDNSDFFFLYTCICVTRTNIMPYEKSDRSDWW